MNGLKIKLTAVWKFPVKPLAEYSAVYYIVYQSVIDDKNGSDDGFVIWLSEN